MHMENKERKKMLANKKHAKQIALNKTFMMM